MGWGTAAEPCACSEKAPVSDVERLTAENGSLRDQLARETALRIAAEQRVEAMAW